jgi:uncharacterized membrane protein
VTKGRLEAFSDGVIAIIITIMVLELKTPKGHTLADLMPVVPTLLAYVLSFIFTGIYWTNHHHMLHVTTHVNGRILWANLHLLFWLSLIPFVTAWAGQSFESVPVAAYGAVLIATATAWGILARAIIADQGKEGPLAQALGSNVKAKVSTVIYFAGFAFAFVNPAIAACLYALVAGIWLVPDQRIEKRFGTPRE